MVISEADGITVEPHGVMNSLGNALLCLFEPSYSFFISPKSTESKDETDFITCREAARWRANEREKKPSQDVNTKTPGWNGEQ